ncbi:MAG TPA: hypothetical protein DF610_19305 [Sphingobacterium sp.]|nr:hypothetical protein [Sphingobacterium sp.]
MKNTFLETHKKISSSNLVAFIDRDRGQIDVYKDRPAVKFPCALIKVNQPRRENLNPAIQRINYTIQIRVAFEKLIEQNNLNGTQRLEQALEYYDSIEQIESLFQGLKLGKTDRWNCVSIIDEDRSDFDVVKMTFTTSGIKSL